MRYIGNAYKNFFPLLLFFLMLGLIWAEEEIVLPEAVIRGEDRSKSKAPSIEFEEKAEELFLPEPSPPPEERVFSWEMEAGAGEDKSHRFLLNSEVKKGERLSFKSGFLYEKDEGYRDNSDFKLFDFSSLFDLGLGEKGKVSLEGNYFRKELGLPGRRDSPTLNNRRKSEAGSISLGWERFFPAENGWRGELSYRECLVKSRQLSSRYRNETTSFQIGYYDAPLSFLASFSKERLVDHYKVEDYALSTRIEEIQITPDFYTSGALKVEKRKEMGFLFLPELKISFEPSEDMAIFLEGGSFLNVSQFGQLYLEENFVEVSEEILKPEHEKKVKLGASKKINKGKIEVSFFNGDRENLIIWADRDENGLYQPFNIKGARIWGGRCEFIKEYLPWFSQKLLYTHQEIENKDSTISYIPYYPCDIFENSFEIKAGRFTFEIIGEYQGEQYYEENNSERLPAYGLLGAKVFYSLNKYAKIFLEGENLTNKGYELMEGYPAAGRRFFGGVKLKF
ncbi:MAG: TonB-dependent receptor [Candidatus Omnitrophica bacterium]|nr:TonB-dependent receptor [Candidatus Omnitrophota bacterium]